MPSSLLFSLVIDDIYFENTPPLPRYPSLIDHSLPIGQPPYQLEPALKVPSPFPPPAGGPFEVIFVLRSTDPVRFLSDNGSFVLRRIDGAPVVDTAWTAALEEDDLRLVLSWTDTVEPPTQVLRLDCTPDESEPRHLFFTFVRPLPTEPRVTTAAVPMALSSPIPALTLERSNEQLIYTVFLQEARAQLHPGFQFEPAFRVPHDHPLQFAVDLAPSTEMQFALNDSLTNQDEVPVKLYAGEENSPALRPTLRPAPQSCIVTWLQDQETSVPDRYLAFNLEIEPASENALLPFHRHRIDPTVIEDPYRLP